MANTIKVFGFELVGGAPTRARGLPTPLVAIIRLERWSHLAKGDAPTISPDLISEIEIDEYIKQLHEDLDAVGNAAKKALKAGKGLQNPN